MGRQQWLEGYGSETRHGIGVSVWRSLQQIAFHPWVGVDLSRISPCRIYAKSFKVIREL